MTFELFVAFRYLKAKRKQTMVSVISGISMLGIAAGVMALVIALALSTGFREDIQGKIIGATSHINLLRLDGTPLSNHEELCRKTSKRPSRHRNSAGHFQSGSGRQRVSQSGSRA